MNTLRGFASTILIIASAVLLVLAGSYYLSSHRAVETNVLQNTQETAVESTESHQESQEEIQGTVTSLGNGWSRYDGVIIFEYPSTWELSTYHSPSQELDPSPTGISVKGNGYEVNFTTIGKGFPGGLHTQAGERVVAGKKTKTLENTEDTGFFLGIGSFCDYADSEWSVTVWSPEESRTISDRILDSVKCTAP